MKKNIKFYKKGDLYNYGMPMKCWADISCYEDYGISIQFNAYKSWENRKIAIEHIDSKKPWSWMFNTILWDFVETFKNAELIMVSNVINEGLIKYFNKHNILVVE